MQRTNGPAHVCLVAAALVAAACTGDIPGDPSRPPDEPRPAPDGPRAPVAGGEPTVVAPPAPPSTVGRATAAQPFAAGMWRLPADVYRNALRDLLGPRADGALALDPDDTDEGFASVGAYRITTSPRGVDLLRAAAFEATGRVFADAAARQALVGCTPTAPTDPCVRTFVERFGRRAWRRPLTATEVDRYQRVVTRVAALPGGGVWKGLEGATAGLLQSPHAVYAAETGEPVAGNAALRRLTGYEVGARMAFFLTGSVPDDELLQAAAMGQLGAPDGLRRQAERLLATPRARARLARFFDELLGLEKLDGLTRDRALYPLATPELFASMHEEVRRRIADLVFVRRGDAAELFDGRATFVDRALAKLYGLTDAVPATGFAPVTLPASGERAGLLGTGALLSLYAHQQKSSPVLRGVLVRERLLCQHIPPPPANVDNAVDDDPKHGKTARERLEKHRADPSCSGCHALFDPIGLALERFDALGAQRTIENGATIDARGDLDGVAYTGLGGLASALRQHPRAARCLAEQVMRFGWGHAAGEAQAPLVAAVADAFVAGGRDLQALLVAATTSDAFRFVTVGGQP